jgi:hypothetical protein
VDEGREEFFPSKQTKEQELFILRAEREKIKADKGRVMDVK